MRLTRAMRDAGIVEISPIANTNGSYTCVVDLSSIDTGSNDSNFRVPDQHHINEIKADFYRRALRNPILRLIGKKAKRLESVDGRNTILVLLDLLQREGDKTFQKITADVHFDLALQEAAKIFYELTMNSKRMDPWSAFNAGLAARYSYCLEIKKTVKGYGYTTPIDNGIPPSRKADLTNTTPLYKAQEIGRLDHFLYVLSAFRFPDGALEKPARRQSFQLGLLAVLRDYSDIDLDVLKGYIGKHDAHHYHNLADSGAKMGRCRLDWNHFREAFAEALRSVRFRLAA